MKRVFWLLPIFFVAACSDDGAVASTTPTTVAAPTPPPKPAYTPEDWKRDFASTFEVSESKTDSSGITSYRACFDLEGKKCSTLMSGMKDGFRKVDHLTPPLTAFHEYTVKYPKKGAAASFVDLRVVAPQCREAATILNPVLHANTWLFMDKVAFMADGDVVYERTAEPQAVKRDTDDGRIWEKWTFKLETADYAKLEKFAAAQSKIIRLSGDKGYTTMSKESVDVFARDVIATIKATQTINDALTKGGGPSCADL
ncbi:hypothetical protein G7048_19190 [Diaphorobacter sp. HDW4B]|uniref:hypothetical protein n=1 Tax=Diaphorobacter sp. HDW4B TaxID=2714925 RepID=UPI001409A1C4|nr:hypothetical protein [Diaphorobacter sp. HDW4B]QIL72291.1 hypothetical protein G7048_19190 [Diaphorobacter sp. HDW4B]